MKRTIEMILMTLLIVLVAAFVGSTLMGCSSDNNDEKSGGNSINPVMSSNHEGTQESLLNPGDELTFFMTEALHTDELYARKTFFQDVSYEEKCLIINSEQEFREAYKGDKELPVVDFSKNTLVIVRTYGEHGGISLGDYELIDNRKNYQLNVTLNNNVNPDYAYIAAFIDIYFWSLYPKMYSKPVIFNRIRQDVNLDPVGDDTAYGRIRNPWILEGYTDADGTPHQVGDGWGDDRFTIQFKENGRVEGRNNRNEFNGVYFLRYTDKREGYGGYIDYGVINLWDFVETKVYDNDPVSKQFMRISDATQFELYSMDYLILRISAKEYFSFRHKALK